jgi:hypothetical protein
MLPKDGVYLAHVTKLKHSTKKGASSLLAVISIHHKHLCGIRCPTQGDYRAANVRSV